MKVDEYLSEEAFWTKNRTLLGMKYNLTGLLKDNIEETRDLIIKSLGNQMEQVDNIDYFILDFIEKYDITFDDKPIKPAENVDDFYELCVRFRDMCMMYYALRTLKKKMSLEESIKNE